LFNSLLYIAWYITNNPDKLDKFKSFHNSYSDTVKKFANYKYKSIVAAITACTANNIEPELISKDKLLLIGSIKDDSNIEISHGNSRAAKLNNFYNDMKDNPDFNNNSEAVKALETLVDIFKQLNSEIMTYMSALTEIVTKLETIFGYEKMLSHTDYK
jgi:hypothetical protein